ncbi:hypothetical protein B9T54_17880 [Leptospira borgpetersenii serovar Hardjo-bovis]|nr:hypothetical protein B9T54_17880 [Leptospira borgpetersenii serovar Hardjo-bovis]
MSSKDKVFLRWLLIYSIARRSNPFFQRILFSPHVQLKISSTYQMAVFEMVSNLNSDYNSTKIKTSNFLLISDPK